MVLRGNGSAIPPGGRSLYGHPTRSRIGDCGPRGGEGADPMYVYWQKNITKVFVKKIVREYVRCIYRLHFDMWRNSRIFYDGFSYIQSKPTRASCRRADAWDIQFFASPLSRPTADESDLFNTSDSPPNGAFHSSSLSGMQKDKSARVKRSFLPPLENSPLKSKEVGVDNRHTL